LLRGAVATPDILPELKRLSDLEVIRLVDPVIVAKSKNGELVRLRAVDLSEKDAANRSKKEAARSPPIFARSWEKRAHGRSST
jgi:hypothetical protein